MKIRLLPLSLLGLSRYNDRLSALSSNTQAGVAYFVVSVFSTQFYLNHNLYETKITNIT
ncbi:hypothetical protein SAMN04488505_110124 [Chitinophaga rupis]|uniref:Uncharacterized protein n=1 Tax=Chitinophaga rupis TaxID=573321 RepID=A0A1H8GFH7_9BACT|nr:hypothetical protein SAMN04488505_110124 [Chitinophaga rupis]